MNGHSPNQPGKVPLVAIVMGSDSDWPTMKPAAEVCGEFGVACHVQVLSAHRTPVDMIEFGRTAHERGFKVIIAGAGGAAHLPGMLASVSPLCCIQRLRGRDGRRQRPQSQSR